MSATGSSAGGHSASSNAEASNREALAPGTRLGDFEIVRTIGSGGFGIVYLAQDKSLDREVAIKEFLPGQLAYRSPDGQRVTLRSASFEANYDAGLQSFVNEARILARFNHPGIVKVHRFWEANGTAYMVMPYVHGPTLRDVRRSMKEAPTEAWLRGVLDPLLDALAMLHAEGIYHRDIAPDNILLPRSHEPVLLDFGAARRVIGDRTQTFTAVLKPSYAPIEQYAEAKQLRQGPWTDLYALGAVVVYMLRAMPPPPSTVRSMHDEMPMLLQEPPAGVSASFLCAVQWALAVRPQDRPQSVHQFRNALDGRISAPLIARRDKVLDAEGAGSLLDVPTAATAHPAEAPAWIDPGPPQPTTVAYAMHGDAPSFEKPEAATWDTTIRLASEAPPAAAPVDAVGTASDHRSLPPVSAFSTNVRARLARLQRGADALTLPRSTMLAAGVAVLLVCAVAFALFKTRLPEPNAATWHEIGRHAKATELIIEEKESDSRPYPPLTNVVMSPSTLATKEQPLVQQTAASVSPTLLPGAAPQVSLSPTRPNTSPVRQFLPDPIAPSPTSEHRAKKSVRTKSAKVATLSPREICGDRNFISAAICMNRRCDEPQFKKHPQCVALLEQRQANMRHTQY